MALTVADALAMPVIARARPEVLCGDDGLARPVRWVHTSEIYEIGPLLKGGEVLLTTGLGLVGADDEALARYADELADRRVAALVLELGRTFGAPPGPLVDAAARRGLPLVVLHGVVPFVEVTQAVHAVLVNREIEELRHAEEVGRVLNDALLSGESLTGLLRRIAELAGAAATLVAADGHVVASSHGRTGPRAYGGVPRCHHTVRVFGNDWGRLEVEAPETAQTGVVLERGAVALGLALLGSGEVAGARGHARRALLLDLAEGRFASPEELAARATAVGFAPRPGRPLAGIALSVDPDTPPRVAAAAVADAASAVFGTQLVAGADGEVLLAVMLPGDRDAAVRASLEHLVEEVDGRLSRTCGGRVLAAAAGPVAREVAGLVSSFSGAREARRLARHLGLGRRVLLASDVGVYRLLSRLTDDYELERFLTEQLGRLLDHDAERGGELVATLNAYLAAGGSKAATAATLGVRRQTVYARLRRIEELVGGTLDDPDRRTALSLALVAWRVRAAGRVAAG